MKTAKLRDEKEVLDRQQHADIEAQKNLEENLQQLKNRKQELESQEKQMQTRLKKILGSVEKHREELTRVRKEQREMKDKLDGSKLVSITIENAQFLFIPSLVCSCGDNFQFFCASFNSTSLHFSFLCFN